MNKHITGMILKGLFLLFLIADMIPASAQIVNTESFDGTTFPPTGWTVSGGGQSLWVRRTTGTNPVCTTHSGAGMARFTSFMVMNGSQDVMTSPVVDYSGASGSIPTFSLWVYRDNSSTAGDSISILVNTSNSLTGAVRIGGVARSRFFVLPINELANGWYNYSFNVPASFNTNTNYILINGTAHGGGNVYVDDFRWTEYTVACATPVAGNAVATDTLICGGGGSTTLSLTGTGLTAGGLTFQWQSGTSSSGPWTDFGANSYTTSSGALTAATWFRCYVLCSNGGTADTSSVVQVNVSPNPPPVVTTNVGATANYCTGSAPLDLVASGAVTYVWNPNIAINATGDSAQATPTGNTSYTVVGFDSLGCSGSTTVAVNVYNSPIVNAFISNDTICSGQSVNLNAQVVTGNFGIQFLWQPGALTGTNHTVSPTVPTTYVVAATSNNTGCTGYDSVSVFVYASPVAGYTYTWNNLTYTFTDTSSGATSWLWNFGDGNTDTTQNPVHTYTSNGNYTVTLTVSNGNCTVTFTQTVSAVGIGEALDNGSGVAVFPNPASDKITVEFYYDATSVQVMLFNAAGQQVLDKIIYPFAGNKFKSDIDVSSLAAGVYAVQVKTETSSAFVRIVKEKK